MTHSIRLTAGIRFHFGQPTHSCSTFELVGNGAPRDASGHPSPFLRSRRATWFFSGGSPPEKGPDVAARWAKTAGRPLRIAAKIPRAQNSYFKERVSPYLDDDTIRFVGEVDEGGKQDLLGNAAALLFPIDWPEPFGLVMIEAMACGTPVIARPRGSVTEIIENGVTGFLVESNSEAVEAISRWGRSIAARDSRGV